MGREASFGLIRFREPGPEDDAALTALVGQPMPGKLSLSFTREPSLLESCLRHGPPRRVLMAEDEAGPLAVCTYFCRPYWVRGEPKEIWTIGDFRATKRAAGKSVTGLGWSAIRERLEGKPALLSLVDDNPVARRLFTKGRKGWPTLHRVALLITYLLPVSAVPSSAPTLGLFQPDEAQICRMLRPSHLSPVLTPNDIGVVTPGRENFLGYHGGVKMDACGALWDPSAYRQIKVTGYGGLYARMKALEDRLGGGLLPPVGSQVKTWFVAFLRGSRPGKEAVFRHLLERAREGGAQFLILGADPNDPPPFPAFWPRFRMRSSLYELKWNGGSDLGFAKSGYEVAWL